MSDEAMAQDETKGPPTRKQFGNAGHFICGNMCRFHLTTQIGDVLISTVGEYFPRDDTPKAKEIGYGRLFETMVFRVGGECPCGCGLPNHTGSERDFSGYNTAKDANDGHEAMCVKYASGTLAPAEEVSECEDVPE